MVKREAVRRGKAAEGAGDASRRRTFYRANVFLFCSLCRYHVRLWSLGFCSTFQIVLKVTCQTLRGDKCMHTAQALAVWRNLRRIRSYLFSLDATIGDL